MNKPKNYDNTKTGGDYTSIELGAHRAIIKQVQEMQSKSGRNMIAVYIDFAAEDRQPKYFENQYKEDTREDKKWPFQAVQYILTEDSDGNTSRSFKGFCTAYEDSNGLTIKWGGGAAWGQQFKGRRIGVVYGEVDEEYNGKFSTRRRIRWFCDDHKTGDQEIPARKPLKGSAGTAPAGGGDQWMPTDFSQEELPF